MLLFAAATQGYFLARSRYWESAALLLVAFTLFVPNFWVDRVQPPFEELPGTAFETELEEAETGDRLRLVVSGPNFSTGEIQQTTLVLDVDETPSAQRLPQTGSLSPPRGGPPC